NHNCQAMIYGKKLKRSGATFIELLTVLILGSLGLFAVSSIVFSSYKEWKRSNELVTLQVDFDLASYMIKSILEEASRVELITESHIIAENQLAGWNQEFYQNSTKLMWKNSRTNSEEEVIGSLKSIHFEVEADDLVSVNLEVQKGSRIISGFFSVFIRNA
ncbi:MAG: hypothetical protein NC911_08975, partial [Candidatus Omnitrophica bacterium]|nr:hypothetical protein [Candidatus Omnitrophota bacterium]